jgi:integrase
MAILAECPTCHNKQSVKNKLCKCGEDLDKAKRSKRVRFWINYRLPGGQQRRESVGYSIEEARDADGKRRTQKRENTIFDIKPDTKTTFQELSNWFMELERVKALPSFRQIRIKLNKFNSELGNRIVSTIKPVDLENLQVKRRKEGLADATIDDEIGQARTVIKKGFENGMISGDTLRAFMAVKKLLKRNANARDRVLTKAEYDNLIQNSPKYLQDIIATGYYTGMRKGEILRLTWDKVDLKNRFIQLEAKDTKTGEPRVVPILGELHEILDVIPRAIHDNHVFRYQGEPVKDIKRSLQTACDNAGITWGKTREGFIFHDLRHTFNTNMRKAGIGDLVAMAITGHATREMHDRYNRIDREDIRQAADRLEGFFQNVDQIVDQPEERNS